MASKKIKITTQNITVEAELLDRPESENFYSSLPFIGRVNTWGLEIYFSIDYSMELQDDASEIVNLGDIAYWPPGSAFCIFFGPTPASIGDEIRAASEVNLLGKIIGDPLVFKSVPSGTDIKIEALS